MRKGLKTRIRFAPWSRGRGRGAHGGHMGRMAIPRAYVPPTWQPAYVYLEDLFCGHPLERQLLEAADRTDRESGVPRRRRPRDQSRLADICSASQNRLDSRS